MTYGTDAITKRNYIEQVRSTLALERSNYEAHWKECADFIKPRRLRFFTTDRNRGEKRNQKIIDGTATMAAETFKSGFHANNTNPSQPWLRLTTPDPELAEFSTVKAWLHTVTQRMLAIFLRSNLYAALPTLYGDAAVFGTPAMGVLDDDEEVLRCYPYPIGSFLLGVNRRGQVDTCIRDYTMSVGEMAREFGRENLSSRAQQLIQDKPWTVLHLAWYTGPNRDVEPGRIGSRFMPWTSCWIEKGCDEGKFLRESGFREFPVLAPRWSVIDADEIYATDWPAARALGDVKQLQTGEKRSAQAIEKMVNPSLQAPASLRNQAVSLLPGGVTYLDRTSDKDGIRTIHDVNFQVDKLEAKQVQVRGRIDRYFYADYFRMIADLPNQPAKTATEIMELAEERLWGLAPVLEQLNDDLYDPLIDRAYALMDRRGLIPPPPPDLQGVQLKVEYVSRLAQSLKLVTAGGHERFLSTTVSLMEAYPEVKHKVNIHQAVDDLGDMYGVNPKWIRGDEEAAESLAAEQQAIQAQQEMELMSQASQSAKNLAGSATEGKNALTDLLQGVR